MIALALGTVTLLCVSVWDARQHFDDAVAELQRDSLLVTDKIELMLRNIRLGAEAVANHIDPADPAGAAEAAIGSVDLEGFALQTVLVVDATGRVVADARETAPTLGLDVSDRAYFQNLMADPGRVFYASAPIQSLHDDHWAASISIPLRDSTGRFAGLVLAAAGHSYFSRAQWQIVDPEVAVHAHLMDAGTTIQLHADGVRTDNGGQVVADLAQRDMSREGRAVGSLDVPDITGFVVDRASEGLRVAVSRNTAALKRDAAWQGITTGVVGACAVAALAQIVLSARQTARSTARDTARVAELEERLRLATRAAGIGVWDLDLETDVNTWDTTMHRLYGTTPDTWGGDYAAWRGLVHPEDIATREAKFNAALETGNEYEDQFRVLTPGGEERVIKARARIHRDCTGKPVRVIGVNYEVTEEVARERALRAAKERVAREALHDPLTDLANRRAFDLALKERDRSDPRLTLLRIDLDHFKHVNDTRGHAAGDHVLVTVAGILRAEAHPSDLPARVGGDEFLILLGAGRGTAEAQDLADRLLLRIRQPMPFEGNTLRVGASFGIAGTENSQLTADNLLTVADAALYDAKEKGRNRVCLYTPALHREIGRRLEIASELRNAIDGAEFVPFYQPQIDARSMRVTGVETLARWQSPRFGLLTPDQFMPVAHRLSLVDEIDAVIFRKAVDEVSVLRADGRGPDKISFNVTATRLQDSGLLSIVRDLDVGPLRVAFEILETVLIEDQCEQFAFSVDALREAGVEIEVDDFGSGHASITGVVAIQPDVLKIDRGLASRVVSSQPHRIVVENMVDLSHKMGFSITAEGVETLEHAEALTLMGCDTLQGYLFSPPLRALDLQSFLWNFGSSSVSSSLARRAS